MTPERLIRDRDKKFTASFDEVVEDKGGEILLTPYRTPVANCLAERMVGTFRREVFNRVIPRGEDHVRELLTEYVFYYHQRPHQGYDLRTPQQARTGEVVPERDPRAVDLNKLVVTPVLTGLVHQYSLVA